MTTCAAQMQRTENAVAEAPCLREQMITERLPLVRAIVVRAIAMRVHGNLPVQVDLDDLIHAGVLGLFDAVNQYDPNKSVAFAKHRIRGAILDSLRQLDWASRDMRRRRKQEEAPPTNSL